MSLSRAVYSDGESVRPWQQPPKARRLKKGLEMSGVQNYERHLANSHSIHYLYSDGRSCTKEIFPALGRYSGL